MTHHQKPPKCTTVLKRIIRPAPSTNPDTATMKRMKACCDKIKRGKPLPSPFCKACSSSRSLSRLARPIPDQILYLGHLVWEWIILLDSFMSVGVITCHTSFGCSAHWLIMSRVNQKTSTDHRSSKKLGTLCFKAVFHFLLPRLGEEVIPFCTQLFQVLRWSGEASCIRCVVIGKLFQSFMIKEINLSRE